MFSLCIAVPSPRGEKSFFPSPVSQKSRNFFGSLSGAAIRFISSQRWGSNPSSFAVLLVFHTLKACWKISFSKQVDCSLTTGFSSPKSFRNLRGKGPWGPFLKSPETFRAQFGWYNSLYIFKTKTSRGTKLCSYFDFYSLYNIWTDQLYRLSRSEFHEWLFGPEKFSGLSRNGPQGRRVCGWPLEKHHFDNTACFARSQKMFP